MIARSRIAKAGRPTRATGNGRRLCVYTTSFPSPPHKSCVPMPFLLSRSMRRRRHCWASVRSPDMRIPSRYPTTNSVVCVLCTWKQNKWSPLPCRWCKNVPKTDRRYCQPSVSQADTREAYSDLPTNHSRISQALNFARSIAKLIEKFVAYKTQIEVQVI